MAQRRIVAARALRQEVPSGVRRQRRHLQRRCRRRSPARVRARDDDMPVIAGQERRDRVRGHGVLHDDQPRLVPTTQLAVDLIDRGRPRRRRQPELLRDRLQPAAQRVGRASVEPPAVRVVRATRLVVGDRDLALADARQAVEDDAALLRQRAGERFEQRLPSVKCGDGAGRGSRSRIGGPALPSIVAATSGLSSSMNRRSGSDQRLTAQPGQFAKARRTPSSRRRTGRARRRRCRYRTRTAPALCAVTLRIGPSSRLL